MKEKTFVWVLLILGLVYSQNRQVCNGNWCIEWSEKKAIASSQSAKKSYTIYKYENTEELAESNNGYWHELSYTMNSVVGTIISYKLSYYNEGGAHPGYGSIFKTFNVATGDTLNLLNFFKEEDIIAALKRDDFVKNSILNIPEVKTLDDFGYSTIDNCAYNLSKSILISSFSFHHTKDSLVAIRIGIPHGCEVNRGNFTQIGIYLPIPPKMKRDFEQAVLQKTLMKDLVVSKKKSK